MQCLIQELITDENKILSTTLKYNIGVLTKNKVAEQDLPEVKSKNELHEQVMNDTTKGEPLSVETYKTVLKHLKNKNMFRHINRAGTYFQDAMFIYMADLMAQERVPDMYDYTKLFGLWKGKGNKLDLKQHIDRIQSVQDNYFMPVFQVAVCMVRLDNQTLQVKW